MDPIYALTIAKQHGLDLQAEATEARLSRRLRRSRRAHPGVTHRHRAHPWPSPSVRPALSR